MKKFLLDISIRSTYLVVKKKNRNSLLVSSLDISFPCSNLPRTWVLDFKIFQKKREVIVFSDFGRAVQRYFIQLAVLP